MKGGEKKTRRAALSNAGKDRFSREKCAPWRGIVIGILCFAGLFLAPVFAEETLEEVEPVAVGPTEVETSARDPFWPVGYTPPERKPGTGFDPDDEALTREQGTMTWPTLTVRGRARGPDGAYRVLMEGAGVVRLGDVVSRQRDGLWFHRRVTHLDGDGMRLVRLGVTREKTPGEDWLRARETGPEQSEETIP